MEVIISPAAHAQLDELPVLMRDRVIDIVDRLARWPQVSGVKWLKGDWKNHARVRTGDYRVVFHLAGDAAIVIDRIAHRRDVYAE